MKKLMYIFLILPLIMSGCKGKKETERGGMSTPEISVAYPLVQNITLTKDYPGYLTTEQTVNLVARVTGNSCEARATLIRNRTNDLQR